MITNHDYRASASIILTCIFLKLYIVLILNIIIVIMQVVWKDISKMILKLYNTYLQK